MSPLSTAEETRAVCDIDGCPEGPARHPVAKFGVTRWVCRRCMQELIAIHGWVYQAAPYTESVISDLGEKSPPR